MEHSLLINYAQLLGYESAISEGLCQGFTAMWIQAVCAGDLATFNTRLKILEYYEDNPEKLINKIQQIRERVKNGAEYLTQTEQIILEIPAFFEGIALYLSPEIGGEMFSPGEILGQHFETKISTYVQSTRLEQNGGLAQVFNNTDEYNQKKLANYLESIHVALKNRPDVAINFTANNHSVAVRVVGDNQFELIDTNNLNDRKKRYNANELAKELDTAFLNNKWIDWIRGKKPLVMSTSVFSNQNATLDLSFLATEEKLGALSPGRNGKTVLHKAISNNDVRTLMRIDFDKIDINKPDPDGITALVFAMIISENDVVNNLLQQPSLEVNKPYKGLTAFNTALFRNRYDLAENILNHSRFDVNVKSIQNFTALHQVAALSKMPTEKAVAMVETLINKGADIHAKDDSGCTPLHKACQSGNKVMVNLLLDKGANLQDTDINNNTPLHYAVLSGNIDLVQSLINKNASLNNSTVKGETVLHIACKTGNKSMVEALLNYPVNINARANNETALVMACKGNHDTIIPLLLNKTDLSVNEISPESPLYSSIKRCDESIQKDFLKKALHCYINDRSKRSTYLNLFNLGFSKDEKIKAAQALLDLLDGKDINLASHNAALRDGRLGVLFSLYKPQMKTSTIMAQAKDEIIDSHHTILELLDAKGGVKQTTSYIEPQNEEIEIKSIPKVKVTLVDDFSEDVPPSTFTPS